VRESNAYEGQAAMELETLAHRHGPALPLTKGFHLHDNGVLDLLPLLAWLADGVGPGAGAAVFHATLALALSEWLRWAGDKSGIRHVALGGGCFLNRLLTAQLHSRMESLDWRVLTARQAPPNDGGLSLGQAWVAMLADPA
jgi:hydrogenase maturation protein HypF